MVSLIEWIHKLTSATGLELLGVFESNSSLLIMHAPWRIWAQLKGLEGFSFIDDTTGR